MSSRHTNVSLFFVLKRCCRLTWAEWTLIITLPSTKVIKSHLINLNVTQSDTHCIFLRSGRILEFRWFQGDFNLKWRECQRRGANVRLLKLPLQVHLGTLNSLLYIRDHFFFANAWRRKSPFLTFYSFAAHHAWLWGGRIPPSPHNERHRLGNERHRLYTDPLCCWAA